MTERKPIELDYEQVLALIKLAEKKVNELNGILKNPEGQESETIRDIELEAVKINDVTRELKLALEKGGEDETYTFHVREEAETK